MLPDGNMMIKVSPMEDTQLIFSTKLGIAKEVFKKDIMIINTLGEKSVLNKCDNP